MFKTLQKNPFQFCTRQVSLLTILYLGMIIQLSARDISQSLMNAINRENIRTVQFFREGWDFSQPILELGTDQRLILKFDELKDGMTNFYYTITHCDEEWYPSRLLQSEYMTGFMENPINDFAASINTNVKYTNYLLAIPNDNIKLLISGNYLISVFDERERTTPVLTRRFYITEPLTSIGGIVKPSVFDSYKGRDQEVDFDVYLSKINVQDPVTEIKVVLMQNFRSDNCITNLKPLFARDSHLNYNLSRENVFAGGNEFRTFDTKNIRINGLGVRQIEFIRPDYHITLRSDQMRREDNYKLENDLNGKFLIKNERASDSDLESDYVKVHFSLESKEPLLGGDIYVFGGLSDWQCLPGCRMNWNMETKKYEVAMFLKQGFYDYQYVYIEKGSKQINSTILEGSHVETENDFQILVYYRGFSSRYDRLIGFTSLNSVKR